MGDLEQRVAAELAGMRLASYADQARAIIPLVLEEAAKRVDQFERPRMYESDFTFIREAAAAIRAI